jgi:hypothetical protein
MGTEVITISLSAFQSVCAGHDTFTHIAEFWQCGTGSFGFGAYFFGICEDQLGHFFGRCWQVFPFYLPYQRVGTEEIGH